MIIKHLPRKSERLLAHAVVFTAGHLLVLPATGSAGLGLLDLELAPQAAYGHTWAMRRRQFFSALALGAGALPGATAESRPAHRPLGGWINVRQHGAAGDGQQVDTQPLQAALDACAGAGGGTVYFPPGVYLSGTLRLRSRVTLHLAAGATLLGSQRLEDYPVLVPGLRSYSDNYTERSLLYGENLESVTLEGRGTIDGQGGAFRGPYKSRPYLIRLIACEDVVVSGLTLRNSAMWVQHYLACRGVRIQGLTVHSFCNANNDGLDLDGCERVRIEGCDIRSGDDALVLKSTLDRPCRNVTISNCLLSSQCNGLKLGTESNGGFQNITISNCVIYDTRLAGLALEVVDGGLLERVNVANLTMHNTQGAVFIRLGDRARPFKEGMARPAVGQLRGVMIRDLQADGADRIGCAVVGLPDHPVRDLTLENVRISFGGGGTRAEATRSVPELPDKYPEYNMFGVLPAYGFYCRHVRGLRLRHVQVSCLAADQRPSLVCEDVQDVELVGWRAATTDPAAPVVHFHQVRRGLVHGCVCPPGAPVFLQVDGEQSAGLRLAANDLSGAKQPIALGHGVPTSAVVAPELKE